MPHADNSGEQPDQFTDPVVDDIAGTGTRRPALPAPACPLRASRTAGPERTAGPHAAGVPTAPAATRPEPPDDGG